MMFRTEVTGINENVWSTSGKLYDTEKEAEFYLDGLALRWKGYDMSRIVDDSIPKGQLVSKDDITYQNYRK